MADPEFWLHQVIRDAQERISKIPEHARPYVPGKFPLRETTGPNLNLSISEGQVRDCGGW